MGRDITRGDYLPRKSGTSRLESLFAEVSLAIEMDRLQAALRLADCACRIAPEDATCLLVHARLLTRLGREAEAVQRLSGRQEPEIIAARGIALCAQGLTGEAAPLCESLLSRFAVDAVKDLQQFASILVREAEPKTYNGWIGVSSNLRLVGQVRTDTQPTLEVEGRVQAVPAFLLDGSGFDAFTMDVPDGVSGRISASANGENLLGSGLCWPPDFGLSGWVVAENELLLGKVRMDWAPALPVEISIGQSGRERIRHTVAPSSDDPKGTPFSIALGDWEADRSPIDVSAILPDGRYAPLVGSPVGIRQVSPVDLRMRSASARREPVESTSTNRMVDIVIPVYAGLVETLCCIRSVLGTTTRAEAELVIVNDASPDSELCRALARFAEEGCITLLTNSSNLGFPGAANKGMNLHPERDIVLLNADTELFGDWLERLKFAAYSDENAGTVTPLGECASIMSYPLDGKHSKAMAAEIDRIAREVNARKVVELPVGVGFCLYIKRACLAETGSFDVSTFSKGYGEENDFCLRARRLGWRHLAATDLFVRHWGARSFGPMKAALMERNGRVLSALYPGYDAMIAGFTADDPLLDARREIDMRLLVDAATAPVMLVTGNHIGGVKKHVEARKSELKAEGHTVLVLHPAESVGHADQVRVIAPDLLLESLVFNVPEDLSILRSFLLKLGLDCIEVHHFMGLPPAVLELVSGLGASYEIYVHDYSWVCPRVSLANGDGTYCGEPALNECEACIREHGSVLDESITVEALRARSARIMGGASRVNVPSNDVRDRLARYFPGRPLHVMAWEAPIARASRVKADATGRVRVAVIGGISVPKGFQVLLECALDAAARELDLEFVVVGYTWDDEALLATGRVFVTGPYDDHEVAALLGREKCDVALFPSVVPETWCYALSHALVGGFPIVAFNLGAIAERLRGYDAASLLPLSTSATETNAALLRAARRTSDSNTGKEPAMETASTSGHSTAAEELTTSLQFLTLPAGTYTFTVKEGAPSAAAPEELALPAIQVGVAPAQSEGTVEFVSRAETMDRWLSRSRDMIVARISGGSASVMLTSLRSPTSPVLGINIQRVDTDLASPDAYLQPTPREEIETPGVFPAQIVAHIHRLGDVPFVDGWAGCIGDRLWIEAFAIMSAGQVPPDSIEYCGVTADGLQTPWIGNRMLCGSRGRAVPMMGYAIRLKPEAAEKYDCTYTGQFVSGKVLGPFKNGDLCCSDQPLDPLWGIELYVTDREESGSIQPSPETENASVA